jgi:hypothetical protein
VIQHPVTVNVAAGVYTQPFVVSNYSFKQTPNGVAPYIEIIGSLVDAAPTTGLVTGTVTSATAGAAGLNWGTVTITGAGWTVDNLRGYLAEITAGPGAGQAKLIESNTATTLTIDGVWSPVPTSASTIRIRTQGTIFDGTATRTAPKGTAPAATWFTLVDNITGSVDGQSLIWFNRLYYRNGAGYRAIRSGGSGYGFTVQQSRFESPTITYLAGAISLNGAGIQFRDTYVKYATHLGPAFISGFADTMGFSGMVVDGGQSMASMTHIRLVNMAFISIKDAVWVFHFGFAQELDAFYVKASNIGEHAFRGDFDSGTNFTMGKVYIENSSFNTCNPSNPTHGDVIHVSGLVRVDLATISGDCTVHVYGGARAYVTGTRSGTGFYLNEDLSAPGFVLIPYTDLDSATNRTVTAPDGSGSFVRWPQG